MVGLWVFIGWLVGVWMETGQEPSVFDIKMLMTAQVGLACGRGKHNFIDVYLLSFIWPGVMILRLKGWITVELKATSMSSLVIAFR